MKGILRFCGLLFAAGTGLFVAGTAAAAGLLWYVSKDLPDYSYLRICAAQDIQTLGGRACGRPLAHDKAPYIAIQAVPKFVINAFLAAEDKNFYENNRLDFIGIGPPKKISLQVARTWLANELPSRKMSSLAWQMNWMLLAFKIEYTYSKDKILELYLNEIFLGHGGDGIITASSVYFNKPINELTVAEAAYLASLPKAPNSYNAFCHPGRALERRNWVIDRMAEAGFITAADAEQAKRASLDVTKLRDDNGCTI